MGIKKKMVVKVYSMNGQNSRTKALKIVVGASGVESATLHGEKNQIEVTGDDIDAVKITRLLRKKMGSTELVTVAPVEEKKEKEKEPTVVVQPMDWSTYPYGVSVPQYAYEVRDGNYDPACCSIM